MFEILKNWVTNNYIELFGTITGLIYVVLSIKQVIWLWPVGFISSAVYIVVFFQSTLYADMGLQVYYLVVSVYGWIHWKNNKKQTSKTDLLKILTININQWIIIISSIGILGISLYYPLLKYTNATNPLFDGFVTSGSIIATWMLARKILEQWLIWIVVDGVSILLFIIKHLYPTAILFGVYTILAIIGYFNWKKEWIAQKY